jgi:hypothetical protein
MLVTSTHADVNVHQYKVYKVIHSRDGDGWKVRKKKNIEIKFIS